MDVCYRIVEHPMMLATNKVIQSKEDVLKVSIIQNADPSKGKVTFCYYQLSKGISSILSYTKRAFGFDLGQSDLRTVNFVLG